MFGPFVTPKPCLFYWPCHHEAPLQLSSLMQMQHYWCCVSLNCVGKLMAWSDADSRNTQYSFNLVIYYKNTSKPSTIEEKVHCINASVREHKIWPVDFDPYAKSMPCTKQITMFHQRDEEVVWGKVKIA